MSCMCLALTLTLLGCQPVAASDQWSQEELEYVSEQIRLEIEAIRKQEFLRPVAVEITDAEGFIAYATERMEAMQTPEEVADQEMLAKLLGLLPPDMDLLATTMEVLKEQVGGFYDPATDKFYLMETFTGGLARVILAHELTHALDDQLYDIDKLLEERIASSDASTAFSAVVEGSGTELMTRWIFKNPGAVTAADMEQAAISTESLKDAPPFIWKPLMSVYLKGQSFLNAGYKVLKRSSSERVSVNEAVAQAFADPPRSMEQVLHPEKYWEAEELDEPRRVEHDLGALTAGWELRERDTLGELFVALVTETLEARGAVDLTNPFAPYTIGYTNDAAAGWDGDEVVLLGRAEARAAHLATCWDSARDAQEFVDAIEALRPHIEEGLAELAGEDGGSGLLLSPASDDAEVTLFVWTGASEEDALALRGSIGYSVEAESASGD